MTATAQQLMADLTAEAERTVLEYHGSLGDLDAGDVWREQPDSFREFVVSHRHLAMPPLYPLQLEAADAILGGDPRALFLEPDDAKRQEYVARLYQIAVLLWGKGSGKDYLSSIIVAYIIYVLLCLRDPQGFFGLAPGEPIDVVNVAYNADQAKRVFFEKLKQRLFRWRWLRENYDIHEAGRRKDPDARGRPIIQINDGEILFPRQIRCFSRHSQNESYEGLNIVAWVMDEASAFLSALKKENADKIYQTLRTSAVSRFQRRWLGFIISYPRHADDFTMQKVREARANPQAGMYASGPHATWDVNKALGKGEWVEVRPGHKVPVEVYNDFLLDYEEALSRYECQPPLARDALIKDPDRLWAAIRKGDPGLIDWEAAVTKREVTLEDGETTTREYAAIKLRKIGKLPKGTRVFMHGDPARTNDAFALAIGHAEPATITLRMPASEVLSADTIEAERLDPAELVPVKQQVMRTRIDAVLVWRPDPRRNRHVDLLNVRAVIDELTKAMRVAMVTFDQYDSAETVQRLEARKVPVDNEQWSNPFQHRIYRGARGAFYNDLVSLPDHPAITSEDPVAPGAIYELARVEEIEGHKIDHPEGGSKDLADAVVRVIEHVTGQSKRQFSFGRIANQVAAGQQPSVQSQPNQGDPGAPSPVKQHLKDREAERERERPLGEYTPSESSAPSATPDDATGGQSENPGTGRFSFGVARR